MEYNDNSPRNPDEIIPPRKAAERRIRSTDPNSVGNLLLNGYTYNALTCSTSSYGGGRDPERDPICTIDKLVNYSEKELLRRKGMGRKALDEIKSTLAARGLLLRCDRQPIPIVSLGMAKPPRELRDRVDDLENAMNQLLGAVNTLKKLVFQAVRQQEERGVIDITPLDERVSWLETLLGDKSASKPSRSN